MKTEKVCIKEEDEYFQLSNKGMAFRDSYVMFDLLFCQCSTIQQHVWYIQINNTHYSFSLPITG